MFKDNEVSVTFGGVFLRVPSRMANRIRVPDFRFCAAALALQRRTGGGLAETPTNLSTVIRTGTALRLDARTLSAEMGVRADVEAVTDNMVRRSGLDRLHGIVATLKQSLRFGTPLAESVRLLAAGTRNTRQMRMKERAARLPVCSRPRSCSSSFRH